MGALDPLVLEIFNTARAIQVNVASSLGPLAPIITGAGQIMAFAISLFLLVIGRGFFAPPTPEFKKMPVRIAGVIAGVGIVGLYIWTRTDPAANVLKVAVILVLIGAPFTLLYMFLRAAMCFRCPPDPRLFVRGLWLVPAAKLRLAGKSTNIPEYDNVPPAPNARRYFCGSKSDPYFVWPQGSQAAAQVLLVFSFWLFIVPVTTAIASGSLALMQLETREEAGAMQISLPADVLFDYDKFTLRPGAVAVLTKVSDLMRTRHATAARIQGHTDARGEPEYNVKLSVNRAEAVRQWLSVNGGLGTVTLSVEGFGATQPVAPNTNPDGSDNPEGRQLNRRVTIVF